MTFLAPAWLAIAGAAAAALVLLHFFARRRPRSAPLPTARFVPDVPARAPSLASTPSDLLLLLVRFLAVLVIGVALARPVVAPPRRSVVRIVVSDSSAAALDSARAYVGAGDTLVGAWERGNATTLPPSHVPTLSTGLVAAIRGSSALRERADSIELVLVSSFTEDRFDAATDSLRRLWRGRARLVVLAPPPAPPPPRIVLTAAADDPLRATVALLGITVGAETRLVRGALTADDSGFAQGGGMVVHWPRDPGAVWPAVTTDTVGAVVMGDVVVVAPFVRTASLPHTAHRTPRTVWVDGVPAALEISVGSGCLRSVAIPVPDAGDLVLTAPFLRLVERLAVPCGTRLTGAPVSEGRLAALRGEGALLPAHLAPVTRESRSSASALLLGVAALLLLLEMGLRPRGHA